MKCLSAVLTAASLVVCTVAPVMAQQELTADQKAKIETKLKQISVWGTDAAVVKAVKSHNTNPPAEFKDMTQEKWKALTMVSPEVKSLTKNELGLWIKSKKDSTMAEVFISGADGAKVAFTNKTTSWIHKGKPKHDVPMTGKSWTGKPELDESTGQTLVQISVPVLDAGKPIGSIVVGLAVSKL